jgi:hypothetical protein
VNRYAVKQSRGLEGPFIFTSASCAIYARIQAAGNSRRASVYREGKVRRRPGDAPFASHKVAPVLKQTDEVVDGSPQGRRRLRLPQSD